MEVLVTFLCEHHGQKIEQAYHGEQSIPSDVRYIVRETVDGFKTAS